MGGEKRSGHHSGGRGHNKKAKYVPNKVSNQAIPAASRGILVTCDSGWEDKTASEIYGVIEEHYVKLAGGEDKAPIPSESTDIASALEAEVAQLKDKKKKRFQVIHPGVRGCLFLEFPKEPVSPTPVEVVTSVCEEALSTKTLRGRHVNRLLPVSASCYASLDEMKALAPKILEQHFPKGATEGIEFAVDYEHRSSDKFDRMEVINAFVDAIETPPHKVNLKNATKTILVQITRNSCGVAVVDRYKELCKFNLRICAQSEEERQQEVGKKPAKPQADAQDSAKEQQAATEPAQEKQAEGEAAADKAE